MIPVQLKALFERAAGDPAFRAQLLASPALAGGLARAQIEKLLGMPDGTIGAPLWVSGDRRRCKQCRREVNWLDIVASALEQVHGREMIARVILGEQKFVNTEAPRAIAGLRCHQCGAPFVDLRSFKCHNWAYAMPALLRVLEQMAQQE